MSIPLHPVRNTQTYVQVVLPLALPILYTYYVPEEWMATVQFGVRAEVQFGRTKRYTGIIVGITNEPPIGTRPKPISAILDLTPLLLPKQWAHWQWLAQYYACTYGEVMSAALPANLKLSSETRLSLSPVFSQEVEDLRDDEYLIVEALTIQQTLRIQDIRNILNRKTVYPIIKGLLDRKIIYLYEDLKERYQPKKVSCVRLLEPYLSQPDTLNDAFEKTAKSERQTAALLAYLQLNYQHKDIRCQQLYQATEKVDSAVLKAMEKKGIFERYKLTISRLGGYEEELMAAPELSNQQKTALAAIKSSWHKHEVTLLHGVTGSGKTRVYIELINEMLEAGKQVLYLLPEIALTTQIVQRLQQIFGDKIGVYHSRQINNQRVELWTAVIKGKPIILGARSALLLPYDNLGLIIVDEEHDASYKQYDPAPRYHARDAAIYLAHLHGAKVLLGTATPSLESIQNARQGKYGLVKMEERFGGLELPNMKVLDIRQATLQKKMKSHFSPELIESLKQTLERGEQAILFQNRRGYAPSYYCELCAWHSQCLNCDVSLTYHQYRRQLQCHYCGFSTPLPSECPACGNKVLKLRGFGTEKIEDELKIYLPGARIARMDLDTVRGKKALTNLIHQFEEGALDILVGTQMVTKGLDFERVGLVGVISADQLLQFPDFRSSERAFQLITQVAGRAGRKHKQGHVLIQAKNIAHPVLQEVIDSAFDKFFERELLERRTFGYPPFTRLIKITLKHKSAQRVNEAGQIFEKSLKNALGDRVLGPAVPYVSRIRSYYLVDFLVKLSKQSNILANAKKLIIQASEHLQSQEGLSSIRVSIDVDPM